MSDNKIETISVQIISGILSNPNYNFENPGKAADIAVKHAEALVARFPANAKPVNQDVPKKETSVGKSEGKKSTVQKDPLGE